MRRGVGWSLRNFSSSRRAWPCCAAARRAAKPTHAGQTACLRLTWRSPSAHRAQQHAIDDILHDLASGRADEPARAGRRRQRQDDGRRRCGLLRHTKRPIAAFMAPTEILAEQHAATLSRLLTPLGISIALLTGSMTTAQRRPGVAGLPMAASSSSSGTHALFSEKTVFHDLGLVIADEQHRFGVAQRAGSQQRDIPRPARHVGPRPFRARLLLLAYGDPERLRAR